MIMTPEVLLSVLRDPEGHSPETQRQARTWAIDEILAIRHALKNRCEEVESLRAEIYAARCAEKAA